MTLAVERDVKHQINKQTKSINSLLCLCWWLFKTLVETPFTYLEVAVLIMWVQVFAQIKVQKSGLFQCEWYQCVCMTHELLIGRSVNQLMGLILVNF